MTCACLNKRGSGRAHFLSGMTWQGYPKGMIVRKTGKGMIVRGGGIRRKRRRKKKKGGMSMTGGGVTFSGGGMLNDAMRVVLNRVRLNRFRRP